MSKREFEDIADNVCSGIISSKQRTVARNELLDHLNCELEDAVSRDIPGDEALKEVINNFGDESEVKKRISKSYLFDNIIAFIKVLFSFLGYTLIAAVILVFQIIVTYLSFVTDSYLFISCIYFIVLGALSFISALRRKYKLALLIIPCALSQLVWMFFAQGTFPPFFIVIPELFKGNLIGFLKDLHYYELIPSELSQLFMIGFINVFAALNALISVFAFRIESKRTKATKSINTLKTLSAAVLVFICFSSALCFGSFFIPDGFSRFDYIEEYFIVPANDQTEIEDILRYYEDLSVNKSNSSQTQINKIYFTDENLFKVWYHHDLNSSAIDITKYIKGKEINSFFNNSEVCKDNTILSVSDFEETQRDMFYGVGTSRVVIKPDKKQGYLVAIPFTNDTFRTDNAEIIELPLEKDVRIHGNMNLNTYEILLKKSSDE